MNIRTMVAGVSSAVLFAGTAQAFELYTQLLERELGGTADLVCRLVNVHPNKNISVSIELVDPFSDIIADTADCPAVVPGEVCIASAAALSGFCRFTVRGTSKRNVRAGITVYEDGRDIAAAPAY